MEMGGEGSRKRLGFLFGEEGESRSDREGADMTTMTPVVKDPV